MSNNHSNVYEFTGKGLAPIVADEITIGQRVYQSHKYQEGVVCDLGTQHSLGVTVIYPDGSESQSQRLGARSPFTCITLRPGVASTEEVEQLRRLRDAKRIADRETQEVAKNQHALDTDRFVKELRAAYPWVKKNNPSANLKKELTTAFPGVKFSVRSDHNSIRIGWIDGPTSKQVEAICGKYENGRFDGMTDCHEYDHSAYGAAVDIVLGRATYIFPSRSLGSRLLRDAVVNVCFEYNHETLPVVKEQNGHAFLEGGNAPLYNGAPDSLERKIYQVAHETAA